MSRGIVLAGIAAIFAAMLGRMGWVDWLAVLDVAGIVGGVVLAIAVVLGIFVGLPVLALIALDKGVRRVIERPGGAGCAHRPPCRVPAATLSGAPPVH